ncbi:MAG TPA: hypothetical protein VFX98_17220, partial [Longimicrobiaceae bacterium]|nr:hypothetical protein [Longimicrobiaceae bacterium]
MKIPGTALLAAALCALPAALPAQPDSALAAALREHRHTLGIDAAGRLTGPGARLLLDAGRASQFFLVAEEHGVAQVPQLATALFRELAPHGYRHLAIETGHATAAQLNRLALEADPEQATGAWVRAHWPGVFFFNLREEARLLAEAVAAAGRRDDVLWGVDYDIMADRWVLLRLRELAPTPAARGAAERLKAHADSLLEAALAAGNPGMVLMFAPSAARVAEVRRAYAPAPGSEAEAILELMEETLRINAAWREGRFHESNVLRAAHLKRRFMQHYRRAGEPEPRVMVKLGANHLMRGRNWTNTFDLGTLAHELA